MALSKVCTEHIHCTYSNTPSSYHRIEYRWDCAKILHFSVVNLHTFINVCEVYIFCHTHTHSYTTQHTHTLIHCKTQTSTKSQQPQKYTRKDCCIANNCGRKRLKWSKIQWHTRIWALFAMRKYPIRIQFVFVCLRFLCFLCFWKKNKNPYYLCKCKKKALKKERETHTERDK